jgi:hypothetical protein
MYRNEEQATSYKCSLATMTQSLPRNTVRSKVTSERLESRSGTHSQQQLSFSCQHTRVVVTRTTTKERKSCLKAVGPSGRRHAMQWRPQLLRTKRARADLSKGGAEGRKSQHQQMPPCWSYSSYFRKRACSRASARASWHPSVSYSAQTPLLIASMTRAGKITNLVKGSVRLRGLGTHFKNWFGLRLSRRREASCP